jgi:fumarylacetoacetase
MSGTYEHHFSERNIPFGIASSAFHTRPQAVTRLANSVVFLSDCQAAGLFDSVAALPKDVFSEPTLNTFASLQTTVRSQVRDVLQRTFQESNGQLESSKLPAGSYEAVDKVTLHMPVAVSDFVGQCLRLSGIALMRGPPQCSSNLT